MTSNNLLLYPWDKGFAEILHSAPPPNWRAQVTGDVAYIAPDLNGVLSVLAENQVDEYLEANPEPEDEFFL
ncbi:hypothetical protein V0288_09210 [Pannus brasiliensis CCIBt3594]|uniref:Uncharacterized protein n=1 Tax=Pannus brasiliensis CCIBt3594 TaxID=1427578 RepID=A0AAW9QU18_9CHRO